MDTAKVFMNGRSQAVRLPAAYRVDTKEVFIHRDDATGDIILSPRPTSWDGFLTLLADHPAPADFLDANERTPHNTERNPLDGL